MVRSRFGSGLRRHLLRGLWRLLGLNLADQPFPFGLPADAVRLGPLHTG